MAEYEITTPLLIQLDERERQALREAMADHPGLSEAQVARLLIRETLAGRRRRAT